MRFQPLRRLTIFFKDYLVRPTEGLLRAISPTRFIRGWFVSIYRAIRFITGANRASTPRKWLHLLFGLPAILIAVAAVVITFRATANQRELGQQYWQRGLAAINQGDFAAAQLHLLRAVDVGDVDSREVQFALAVVWEKLGFAGRSMQTFQQLAPTNRLGFPKAHRHLAILIGSQSGERSNDVLTRWLWHLTHADEQESAEIQGAWGNYYIAVDDVRAAIKAYSAAASRYPQLYLTISNLYQRLGNVQQRTEVLQMSRARYSELLTKNPNDRDARVIYATTLLQLGELTEAEQVLRTGLRLDPGGPYQLLLAAMFVQLHDKLMERGAEYQSVALQQIRNALEFDPNFEPALNRLLGFAQVDPESIPELREMLNELLASGEGTALGHLALSNLAWLENRPEVAAIHIELAMGLDDKMPVIANNFAWLLAHADPPNLPRSLAITDAVIKNYPDNARFLDTRGTVLLKLERYREALLDLEKALPQMPDKGPVHQKIAMIYEALGMEDLAKQHTRLAGGRVETN